MANRGVRELSIKRLREHPDNPRTIEPERLEQLKRALTEDPGMLKARPLIALPDGTVVAGNMRLRAARELGWTKIPVFTAELDEATAKLWMIRDNESMGAWDEGPLAEMLASLDVDLALTGLEGGRIDELLAGLAEPKRGAPPEPGPLPAKPRSKRGQVYELGEHRLMCGDATSPADVEKLMGGGIASALWTDPPYGVGYVGKTKRALTLVGDDAPGLPALLEGAFTAATAVLEPGSPFYIAAPAGPLGLEYRLAVREVGWHLHAVLVWVKNVLVLGHSDYHYRHEDVLYGWTPGEGRSGRGAHAGSRWYGDNAQDSVFQVDRPSRSEEHPTMKPPELIASQLENSTRVGEVVLDCFAGSGSTIVAAEQLGRRCYAMEIDPAYCDVIRDRWARWERAAA